jgi:hypothetical protein
LHETARALAPRVPEVSLSRFFVATRRIGRLLKRRIRKLEIRPLVLEADFLQ